MKISINIPSYKRPEVETLKYIPWANVYVDICELQEYRDNNKGANIIGCPKGIQGNLCRVRNYIIKQELEVKDNDVCLIVDDDLQYIERFELKDDFAFTRYRVSSDELNVFIAKYSQMAKDMGAKFWGIVPNSDNLSYRHNTPFSTRSYIGGPFQCFLKGNRCYYDEKLPLKEDYDMTLQQLNTERVALRINSYHYICRQSTNKGGCATYRNRLREQSQFEALQRKWGGVIVKRDTSNKGKTSKQKFDDYNPIIKPPIQGV